jgi:hypothetical protein
MRGRRWKLWLVSTLLGSLAGNGRAEGKVIDDGPHHKSEISSIGDVLRQAGKHPVHILYVHGIGAEGAGDSHMFLTGICPFLPECKVPAQQNWQPVQRDYADRGEFQIDAPPPRLEYLGQTIWKSQEAWRASAPFVDHYVLKRSDGGPVVVDELNWWPLVFPLKCGQIMAGEARLSGPSKEFLDLCSKDETDPAHPKRYKFYPWIDPDEAKALEGKPRRGALFNYDLKTNPLDWGFSDAIMAVGTLHEVFREGMRQLFVKCAGFSAETNSPNDWKARLKESKNAAGDFVFIAVSHSLGSYLMFSTMNMDQAETESQNKPADAQPTTESSEEDQAAQYIFQRTSMLYFFANQVPLLELANVENPEAVGSLGKRLLNWKEMRHTFVQSHVGAENSAAEPNSQPQVVAWSDPSDLLTWRVPQIGDLVIVNLYVRNTWWRWLFIDPIAVHDNYARNKEVLRTMMLPTKR